MKKMNKFLTKLFDYQRFEDNDTLRTSIERVASKEAVSFSRLATVSGGATRYKQSDIQEVLEYVDRRVEELPLDKRENIKGLLKTNVQKWVEQGINVETMKSMIDTQIRAAK